MKKQLLKLSVITGLVISVTFVSCSKKELNSTEPTPVVFKKDAQAFEDSINSLLNEFMNMYDNYSEQISIPSDDPILEYDKAVWIIEAALNRSNSIDPTGPEYYVDMFSPFETESTNLEWTEDVDDELALVSYLDLMVLYDYLWTTVEGKAPITDVKITGGNHSVLHISAVGFAKTTTPLTGFVTPIPSNAENTAVMLGTCDINIPSGPGNFISGSQNVADIIDAAMGPYGYTNAQTQPPGWKINGWYHSILGAFCGPVDGYPGTLDVAYRYKSTNVGFDPVLGVPVYTLVGNGFLRYDYLWGGYELYHNATSRSPFECLDATAMTNWKNAATYLMNNDAADYGGIVLYHLGLEGKYDSNDDEAWHQLTWVAGKFSTHND